MLNINELRHKTRRVSATRRNTDRRVASYVFSSPEWQANIEANYAYCPKFERRQLTRRDDERRSLDRRQHAVSNYTPSDKRAPQLVLTREERRLIEDLYLCDLS
jgi:hypothetical protein